jgi:hypothetical protein
MGPVFEQPVKRESKKRGNIIGVTMPRSFVKFGIAKV